MREQISAMRKSTEETYQTLGIIFKLLVLISQTYLLGKRTFSQESQVQTDKMVLDKVLSDDRTAAYVTSIDDINRRWLNCKDCNWYKSKQTIYSEVWLKI